MSFLFVLQNLHSEITKYLYQEDIINIFSISKDCFDIDYKFPLLERIYDEISANKHFKKFYPVRMKINNDSNIVITSEIAVVSTIFTSSEYFFSDKCVSKIFKNLHLSNDINSLNGNDIVLSQYIIKNFSVYSLNNMNIIINCIEMSYLIIYSAENTTIKLKNVSNKKINFRMEYSSNIRIFGIPENNKIYFYPNNCFKIITNAPVECQTIDIESKNRIIVPSRKYILNGIYTADDLEAFGPDMINKIKLGFLDFHNPTKHSRITAYVPKSNENNYLCSCDPLYSSLYFSEFKSHNITNIHSIKKKFLKIVNLERICPGLVINNCEIDIFSAKGTFVFLQIEKIISTTFIVKCLTDFRVNNCKINELYCGVDIWDFSTIEISESDIDLLNTCIYAKIISNDTIIKCVMYDIRVNWLGPNILDKLSELNCDLQHLKNKKYAIKQIVYLPNISRKYVITHTNCKYIVVHTNDVEEILFNFDLNSSDSYNINNPDIGILCTRAESINIIGNPKIIEIPKEASDIVMINDKKFEYQSLYRIRKITYSTIQYVLNYK